MFPAVSFQIHQIIQDFTGRMTPWFQNYSPLWRCRWGNSRRRTTRPRRDSSTCSWRRGTRTRSATPPPETRPRVSCLRGQKKPCLFSATGENDNEGHAQDTVVEISPGERELALRIWPGFTQGAGIPVQNKLSEHDTQCLHFRRKVLFTWGPRAKVLRESEDRPFEEQAPQVLSTHQHESCARWGAPLLCTSPR